MSSTLAIVSSAASLYLWINAVSDIVGSKILLVCKKDCINLQQTDHNQICLVDAKHVASLEGGDEEGFNVAVDTKRLLAILRQGMPEDVAKLCIKDEKILEVVLHSRTRQVCLDVPIRPIMKPMITTELPKPTFELAIPVSVFKGFLALTRQSGKVMGIAIAGDKKTEKLFLVLFGMEIRSLWRINNKADDDSKKENEVLEEEAVVDVDMTSMAGFFRQIYRLGIIKTIFKGLSPEQRVVIKLHQSQPLQIILPTVGGKSTRFVVATVIEEAPPAAKEPEKLESKPELSGDDEDLPALI